jgi:hypothetical protein
MAQSARPLDTAIVGTKFRGKVAIVTLAALRKGAPLSLRRELKNPHDANAIAVYSGAEHLGYVPKIHNAELAATLDRGGNLVAELIVEAVVDRGEVVFAAKIRIREN